MLARTVRILVTNMVKAVIFENVSRETFSNLQRDVSRETPARRDLNSIHVISDKA